MINHRIYILDYSVKRRVLTVHLSALSYIFLYRAAKHRILLRIWSLQSHNLDIWLADMRFLPYICYFDYFPIFNSIMLRYLKTEIVCKRNAVRNSNHPLAFLNFHGKSILKLNTFWLKTIIINSIIISKMRVFRNAWNKNSKSHFSCYQGCNCVMLGTCPNIFGSVSILRICWYYIF